MIGFKNDISPDVFSAIDMRAVRVGVGKASTFPGFCSEHDVRLFAAIDTADADVSQETSFLLAYRALSRELYFKEEQLRMIPSMRKGDGGLPHERQLSFQQNLDWWERGTAAGVQDLKVTKKAFDEMLLSGESHGFEFVSFAIAESPEVCCSATSDMIVSIDGTPLDGTTDSRGATKIMMTVLPTESGGLVSFGWLRSDKYGLRFAEGVCERADDGLADAALSYMFANVENIFAAPPWWKSLGETKQGAVLRYCGQAGEEIRRAQVRDPIRGLGRWSITDRMKRIRGDVSGLD